MSSKIWDIKSKFNVPASDFFWSRVILVPPPLCPSVARQSSPISADVLKQMTPSSTSMDKKKKEKERKRERWSSRINLLSVRLGKWVAQWLQQTTAWTLLQALGKPWNDGAAQSDSDGRCRNFKTIKVACKISVASVFGREEGRDDSKWGWQGAVEDKLLARS